MITHFGGRPGAFVMAFDPSAPQSGPSRRLGPGEFDLIAGFRARAGVGDRIARGIGDDCAVIEGEHGGSWLWATDMLMDGRHFQLEKVGARAVGRKAMGVNLSDIAAMAGRPVAALVAVALPRDQADQVAMPLFEGLTEMAESHGASLVGGDTNAWDGPLVVCVSILGESVQPGPALRSEAKPGDIVLVTGPLGGSLLGRHLEPKPRIAEALALRSEVNRMALIDLSDGLASDLGHILSESGGLGALIVNEDVPIHPDAHRLAEIDGRPPLEHALTDGEDFELCLTVSEEDAQRLLAQPPEGVTLYRIGTVTAEPGLRFQGADGSIVLSELLGFDHLAHPTGKGEADGRS